MNNTWKIYMLTFISFVVGTTQFVIVGILDKIAASFGVSVSTAGQLGSAFSLAYAIGTPIVMVATAKIDRRKQLLLGLAVLLLGIVLTVAIPGFVFLMASRVILGVGAGVITVTAYATAAKMAPPGRQAGAVSNVTLGFSASIVFGVPIGRVVAAAYDWIAIFWGIGLLSMMSIVAIMRTIPAMEGEAPVPIGKQLAFLKKPKIAIAFSLTLLTYLSYSVVYTYITPFLASVAPKSEQGMSSILFALGIASLIGSKLGGFLADRTGTAYTLVGGMVVQAIALVLLSIVSGSVSVTVSLLMAWMIASLAFMPAQTLNLITLAPEASGIMLSLNGSFIQFGFALGAGIGGIAVGGTSIMAISWIGAASIALAAVLAVISFGLTRSFSDVRQ
ncbi:Hypothetical protein LUCI_0107 [Lucifera butyrica]|uniref:Major facilitator superfamily (MFS) profile domain-containing protein n=1 Tax=Lucifera butyrica TaxID=1351585 RepID=A0A498R0Q8_9FIRM|nr:MFS transporter [Lucifera butyrica]VBB04901.1 Hypothetical protein LUCI_0107 [Lucifera butyrica]